MTCVEAERVLRLIDVVNMRPNAWMGEVLRMSDAQDDEAEVQRRLEEIQHRRRHRIRWGMTPHTAELALTAVAALTEATEQPRRCGKRRRRKRHKRLL